MKGFFHSESNGFKLFAPAYMAWFISLFLFQIRIEWYLNFYIDKNGKPNPKEADILFFGRALLAFGVDVKEYFTPSKFWICVLISILPAIIVLFLTYWFADPEHRYSCYKVASISVPGQYNNSYCPEPHVCCKAVQAVFSPVQFSAFFAGNVLSAYKAIQYAAKVRD